MKNKTAGKIILCKIILCDSCFWAVHFSPLVWTLSEQIGALADQHIVHVACGESHSLALSDRGQLFSWGAGSDGQLGLMTTEDSVAVPR